MSSEPSPRGLATALARWGGFLLRPRATIAALPHDAGRRDGLVFLLLYAAGAHLPVIGDAVADFLALASLAAVPILLSGLAAIVPWLVATLGVEAVLGPGPRSACSRCCCSPRAPACSPASATRSRSRATASTSSAP